jgi:type I restriction enzyme R subunit
LQSKLSATSFSDIATSIKRQLGSTYASFHGSSDAGTSDGDEGDETDPAKPEEDLLADLAEAIALARAFLDERGAALDDVIQKTGFERNAAIVASKEAANENDETRKRFEVMCREVFKKFKACINSKGVNAHRAERDAINIVYKSLQQDTEQADISEIIRQLHEVVDDAIDTQRREIREEREPYDISAIDFDRLKQEFERSPGKNTTVQNLREAIEKRLQRLLRQHPLRTDFQRNFEEIVAEYNRAKDRMTVEHTFEALLKLVQELDDEDTRAVREGLDEESLAIFDLLKKSDLNAAEVKQVKTIAVELLGTLKAEKLRVDQWREKEASRDAVRQAIRDFLWSDNTGLPIALYTEDDVNVRAGDVFRHVYQAYPTVPSPYCETTAA